MEDPFFDRDYHEALKRAKEVFQEKVCNSLDDIEKMFPNLDGILEGEISFGQASTIVDCTSSEIKIQRPGPISVEKIMEVLKK